MSSTEQICELSDAGRFPAQIADLLGVTKGRVYDVLRQMRPNRARKPRQRISLLPAQIKSLHSVGTPVPRIAQLLEVSRAYVYKVLQDDRKS